MIFLSAGSAHIRFYGRYELFIDSFLGVILRNDIRVGNLYCIRVRNRRFVPVRFLHDLFADILQILNGRKNDAVCIDNRNLYAVRKVIQFFFHRIGLRTEPNRSVNSSGQACRILRKRHPTNLPLAKLRINTGYPLIIRCRHEEKYHGILGRHI